VALPEKGEDPVDWLGARFVGPDLLATVNSLAEEATAWSASDGHGNGHEAYEAAAPRPPWLAPEEPEDAFPPDDDFDALPSAAREPAQAAALTLAAKDLFWSIARQRGREGGAEVAMMARAAELTGDWGAALTWLQGPA
jgi:hypothetical protein